MATDATIYVSNGPYVQRYSPDGRLLGIFGGPGSGPAEFGGGSSTGFAGQIAVAPNGTVLVDDRVNNRIERFTPIGGFIDEIARRGAPSNAPVVSDNTNGQTVRPDGVIAASDIRGVRLLNPDGSLRVQRSIAPGFLAFAGATLFNAVPFAIGQIGRLDAETLASKGAFGRLGQDWFGANGPQDIAVSGRRLWALSRETNRALVFSTEGARETSCPVGFAGSLAGAPGGDVLYVDPGGVHRIEGGRPFAACDLAATLAARAPNARFKTKRGRRGGLVVRLLLSKPAAVTFTWTRIARGRLSAGKCKVASRRGKRCLARRAVGRQRFQARGGLNVKRPSGIVARKRLRRGLYALRVSARAKGAKPSKPVTLRVRVIG